APRPRRPHHTHPAARLRRSGGRRRAHGDLPHRAGERRRLPGPPGAGEGRPAQAGGRRVHHRHEGRRGRSVGQADPDPPADAAPHRLPQPRREPGRQARRHLRLAARARLAHPLPRHRRALLRRGRGAPGDEAARGLRLPLQGSGPVADDLH
ncbi:MAG: Copper binding protein, plastocyanin/azurin family, partial [uncultured Solirubrobacteraceae bacterium]